MNLPVTQKNYFEMFGNDSGEDELPDILESYFIKPSTYNRFFDARCPLSIVRARKGMGKSALLRKLEIDLERDSANLTIRITGNDLIALGDFTDTDQALLEQQWKQAICKCICLEIGKRISFAFTDDKMSLVESAEIEGFKGRNIVSALADRVAGIIQTVLRSGADADVKPGTDSIGKLGVKKPLELLKRYQDGGDGTQLWILVDDIDAKYRDNEQYQERVGSFFSAIRGLAFTVNNLRLRASIRTDVWYNLRKMEDQDKIRQYVFDICWNDDDLRIMLAKKILSYYRRNYSGRYDQWDPARQYMEIMNLVFERTFRWGNKSEEPFIPLKILAGSRPRWIGQLCKLAAERSRGAPISMDMVKKAMPIFGKEKFSDLQKEHAHQFSDLSKLADAFKSGEREYTRYQLLKRIEKYYVGKVNSVVPEVNGYPYINDAASTSGIAGDQLGEFLFQTEFISGWREDGGFYLYQDHPDLFSSEDNKQNKIEWTVSPSYRQYLDIK